MDNIAGEENLKLKYLFNIYGNPSVLLPEKLKNIYSNLSIALSSRNNINIGKAKNKSVMCPYCDSLRTTENSIYKISPTIRPGPAMRRILQKVQNKKKLSTIEKKLALRVHSGNYVVIKCLLCHKSTKMRVSRPQESALDMIGGKKKNKKGIKKRIEEAVDYVETPAENILLKKKKIRKAIARPFGVGSFVPDLSEQSHGLSMTVNSSSSVPMTPIYEVGGSLLKKSNFNRSKLTNDFIPLSASSPMNVPAKVKSNILANPYCIKTPTRSFDNRKAKKSQIAALQQTLRIERSAKLPRTPRLKDFLNSL